MTTKKSTSSKKKSAPEGTVAKKKTAKKPPKAVSSAKGKKVSFAEKTGKKSPAKKIGAPKKKTAKISPLASHVSTPLKSEKEKLVNLAPPSAQISSPEVKEKYPSKIENEPAPVAQKKQELENGSAKVKEAPSPEAVKKEVSVPEKPSDKPKINFNEMMAVKDLAAAMKVSVTEVIKKLLSLGNPATINQRLETDVATLLAEAFGFELQVRSIYEDELIEEKEQEHLLKSRPPVVTVMGHVDHGKTSLLDVIRKSKVAEKEAGGITQHIGAYQVQTEKGVITFIDTPGHEAFTAMRARGATVTDLVVLVVAADDSVMPQTVEAIDHAKAAQVPIIVAINKVDLPQANVQKVKQELSQYNLLSEDWGGKTQMAEVSAKTQQNIDQILEMILLEAELMELKANPDRPAKGVVLEARLDKRKGVTTTVLIQAGTLRVGDVLVCGLVSGRVRAMFNDKGNSLQSATPSDPVEILGLGKVPQVGDQLSVVKTDKEAREIAERRTQHVKDAAIKKSGHVTLENLHSHIEAGETQELTIVLKADVQGSLQAIQDSLAKLSSATIQLKFIHTGVGNINHSDVLLAETSDSIIFGFHVKPEPSAEIEAKKAEVDIRLYSVIYEIFADVKAAMEGLLKPVEIEIVKGRALVKNVFASSRYGGVAGCLVQEGKMTRGQKARLLRQGTLVSTGSLTSLKRFKEDVKEVDKGYECGLAIEGIKSFKQDDVIEVYVVEKHARRLEH